MNKPRSSFGPHTVSVADMAQAVQDFKHEVAAGQRFHHEDERKHLYIMVGKFEVRTSKDVPTTALKGRHYEWTTHYSGPDIGIAVQVYNDLN